MSDKTYSGPLANVRLELIVDSMATHVAHYFDGFEAALQDRIKQACVDYIHSRAFEEAIAKAVEVAIQRTIEQAANNAVYNRGFRETLDAQITKLMPQALDAALAKVNPKR